MPLRTPLAAAALGAAVLLAACGSSSSKSSGSATTVASRAASTAAPTATTAGMTASTAGAMSAKDIVDTAVGAGSFKTLATLLTQAGLVSTLKGAGPFTVFAPTDDAFAKVDAATLAKLAANKDALTKVLTYHVVAGKVMATDVKPGPVKTVEGSDASITVVNGTPMIDNAKIVKTDVVASNGVIHVIDSVIIPKDLNL